MPPVPRLLPLSLPSAAFLTLNLKALTIRKTFSTVNKHVNKSTHDTPRFEVYIQSSYWIPIALFASSSVLFLMFCSQTYFVYKITELNEIFTDAYIHMKVHMKASSYSYVFILI